MNENYEWTDNPTVSGLSVCDTDVLNDCLMHLKYSNNSDGLPLLYIGQSFYVDESLGIDYYLNGQVLAINDNLQEAVNKLKTIATIRPTIFTTEEEWQTERTTSAFRQVGKFVLDEELGTLRLPAIVNLQGLLDLSNLCMTVEAGLPNITGTLNGDFSSQATGAFYKVRDITSNTGSGSGQLIGFDASRANAIYGNSDTVQPEAIQCPYFIRLATGKSTRVNITNEIQLNNPYTLLEFKFAKHPLYNASWLLSAGQFYSGNVYVSVYEGLQVEANSDIAVGATVELPSGLNYTKRGLSVVLSTDEYDDFDFVLNTVEASFRLPVKVLAEQEELLLYFYAGETVQNANFINAGRIGDSVALKTDMTQAAKASLPSNRYIDLSINSANNIKYTIPADGFFAVSGSISSGNYYINLIVYDANDTQLFNTVVTSPSGGWGMGVYAPVQKGMKVEVRFHTGVNISRVRFIYAEGAQ